MTFGIDSSPDFPAVLGLIERDANGRASAQLGEYRLSSHFQPIVSLSHQRVIGHEGLMRASKANGQTVSPVDLLVAAQGNGELVAVDRVARALHVLNRPASEAQWLFLNVHPEVFIEPLTSSSFTADLLAHQQMTNVDVVIEVLEDAIRDEALFAERVGRLHEAGFLIALDDFGAGHSNFDRVWTVKPDIVKLDRSFALRSEQDAGARRLMPRIVNLLHEAGSLVLLEGIETAVQAQIALDSDIDFVQGYYFARPSAIPEADVALEANIRALWHDFSAREAAAGTAQRELIAPYQNALGYASVLIVGGHAFPEACKGFLELPLANFCYLLDREGRQIGQNVWNTRGTVQPSQRYQPLSNASEARWSRRPYFRRAIRQLDRVQVTRPYLSASTAELCVTLSVGFLREGEPYVLCGDIAWPG
ncbi:MAG: EAL domain-containing protein [Rhodocyclaceae bacterium]|nr:EAL domain-containing protein [Rhodocyclaceae bacterium]MDZ4216053.1 EAL domain-containing protein [Rhodocyclaceae bacterium]